MERVSKPGRGVPADEEKIAVALAKARVCLTAMSDLMGDTSWLVGEQPTLADLYAAPMFDYFFMTPEGVELINQYANLKAWWSRMALRPSMIATKPS
uniref:Glutathione S-transferase, C-terminal domain protein n=1 Tax=Rhizobium rhizogenes TaxID=359 RepID=A0A7S5DT15_RHIRH|nr:glutathione S-transferase, C-terminal domain protein [Rhizobium rhizogenes]